MAAKSERMSGEPIIVVHLTPPLNPMEDPVTACRAVAEFKRDIGGKVYRIMDFSQCKNMTFPELALGMAEDSKPGIEGGGGDPDVIFSAFVAENKLVELGVKGYQEQAQYHIANPTALFSSVDAALAHIRGLIAKK